MGYPMSWKRMVARSGLAGGYSDPPQDLPWPESRHGNRSTAGDMRRVEQDQRDERHLALYAATAGITPEQARRVLDAFFESDSFLEPEYRALQR